MAQACDLTQRTCVPCRGGVEPLKGKPLQTLAAQLGEGWQVVGEHHLEKTYRFKDFRHALDFTNRVGELAEKVGHHPQITLSWGKVVVTVWTHKIGGLVEADFVFAAKTDQVL